MPPENQTTTPKVHKSSGGPMFGALIIIIVLVFGAFYFWDEHLKLQARNTPPPYIPSDSGGLPIETSVTATDTATSTLD